MVDALRLAGAGLVQPGQHVPHIPGHGDHNITLTTTLTPHRVGSWACISMGLGVPPAPPTVSASMKLRTIAARRPVMYSSTTCCGQTKYFYKEL